ncbi:MAG: DUF4145 domain-containing protein, partial [bacterium]
MNNDISNIDNLLNSLLVDLDYVVRISSLYGLIGCRAYIEKILNIILDEDDFNSPLTLADKINLLEERGILKGRMLTEIQNIRYKGNDASHKLIGTESEANSALATCEKFKEWYLDYYNKTKLKNNQTYYGIIRKYGNKKYGFIKESKTGENVYFDASKQNFLAPKKINPGYKVKFKVKYTSGKTPYEAYNLKIIGKIKNIDTNNNGKFGFINGNEYPDIYFSFDNINDIHKGDINIGDEIAF